MSSFRKGVIVAIVALVIILTAFTWFLYGGM